MSHTTHIIMVLPLHNMPLALVGIPLIGYSGYTTCVKFKVCAIVICTTGTNNMERPFLIVVSWSDHVHILWDTR